MDCPNDPTHGAMTVQEMDEQGRVTLRTCDTCAAEVHS